MNSFLEKKLEKLKAEVAEKQAEGLLSVFEKKCEKMKAEKAEKAQ